MPGPEVHIKMSMNANDITVLVKDQGNLRLQVLKTCLKTYDGVSTARVNWEKSKALLCGLWDRRLS